MRGQSRDFISRLGYSHEPPFPPHTSPTFSIPPSARPKMRRFSFSTQSPFLLHLSNSNIFFSFFLFFFLELYTSPFEETDIANKSFKKICQLFTFVTIAGDDCRQSISVMVSSCYYFFPTYNDVQMYSYFMANFKFV